MELAESIDRYLAAVHDAAGGFAAVTTETDPFWLPDRGVLENVVGFEIPDEVWELWGHDLVRNHPDLLPHGSRVRGPQRLFSEQFSTYGVLHFGVDRQLPIIHYSTEHRVSLIVEVGAWPEIWMGGWFDGQTQCHQIKLSLVEMFETFADGIEAGLLCWSPRGGVGASEELVRLWRDYDPDDPIAVLWYALRPRQVDEAEAVAAGAIMDEDYDLDLFDEEVLAVATERRQRWERMVGPFPAGVLNDRFG